MRRSCPLFRIIRSLPFLLLLFASPFWIRPLGCWAGDPGTATIAIEQRNVQRKTSTTETSDFERIYHLITNLCVEQDVPYARLLTAEKRRERLLKIIWSVGMWGEIGNNGKFIEVDSKTFSDLKLSVMYKSLLEDFHFLKQHSVNCEIIPLMPKRWLTPMGGLRKEGWVFRISFDDGRSGNDVLLAFREYINRLKKRYGEKAFRYFKIADMSVI